MSADYRLSELAKSSAPGRLAVRLLEACARYSDRPAISDNNGNTLTYTELAQTADVLSSALRIEGIETDEPVLATVSNRAEDIAAFLAIWMAGAVAVPVHREARRENLDAIRQRTGARYILNACPDLPIAATASGRSTVRISDIQPAKDDMLKDAAWVVFTSGSTGQPKGVVHAHDHYVGKLHAITQAMATCDPSYVLMPLQLTFGYAHWVCLSTLLRGGEVRIALPYRPQAFLQRLIENASMAAVVPTMLGKLRELINQSSDCTFKGSLVTGGECLSVPLIRFIRERWPQAEIWDVYGSTETATSDFYARPSTCESAVGTIGRPAPGVTFRIDEANGELQIRSPYFMRGYLKAPRQTDEAFFDGYFRTGDQVEQLAEGNLRIVGRLKDLIIRSGNKIAPSEIESIYISHPEIDGALAVGVPGSDGGESLHVALVRSAQSGISAAEIMTWSKSRLESFRIPDRLYVVGALPTGATDKADRNALRQLILTGKIN